MVIIHMVYVTSIALGFNGYICMFLVIVFIVNKSQQTSGMFKQTASLLIIHLQILSFYYDYVHTSAICIIILLLTF